MRSADFAEGLPIARYVALLRAINVGGHTVKMDQLRGHFEALGFGNVATLIASGNVIFETSANDARSLETKIERHLEKALGYEVATFVRTTDELAAVVAHRAYADAIVKRAHALWIAFLKDAPTSAAVNKLTALRCATDDFHVHGREVYWLRNVTSTDSKVTGAMVERALGGPSTARNITTVTKLANK